MKGAKHYKAIFFDPGDTLIYISPSRREVARRLVERHGKLPGMEGLRLAHLRFVPICYFQHIDLYRNNPDDFWSKIKRWMLEKLGERSERYVERLLDEYKDSINYGIFPDTIPVLERLKGEGYLLGLISNYDAPISGPPSLRDLMKELNLSRCFDVIVSSAIEGVDKPDPRIFRVALELIGVEGRQALHIGDRYEKDVIGAAACGITPILLDRNNGYPQVHCLKIRNLYELLSLLGYEA